MFAIVDWDALLTVIWASLVAGIGVTAAFGFAILGGMRAVDLRRDGRVGEATLFGVVGVVGLRGGGRRRSCSGSWCSAGVARPLSLASRARARPRSTRRPPTPARRGCPAGCAPRSPRSRRRATAASGSASVPGDERRAPARRHALARAAPASPSASSAARSSSASKPASSSTSSAASAHSIWCGAGKPIAKRRASGCRSSSKAAVLSAQHAVVRPGRRQPAGQLARARRGSRGRWGRRATSGPRRRRSRSRARARGWARRRGPGRRRAAPARRWRPARPRPPRPRSSRTRASRPRASSRAAARPPARRRAPCAPARRGARAARPAGRARRDAPRRW